jgi:hypothetical protein
MLHANKLDQPGIKGYSHVFKAFGVPPHGVLVANRTRAQTSMHQTYEMSDNATFPSLQLIPQRLSSPSLKMWNVK